MTATTADAAAETNRMAKEKKDKALPLKDQPIKYWGKAYGGCSLVAVGGWLLLWLLFLLLDVLGAGLSPDFHWGLKRREMFRKQIIVEQSRSKFCIL